CGRFGHIARVCPTPAGSGNGNGGSAFTPVQRPANATPRSAAIPPVKCFKCGGYNHMSRDCLAPPGTQVTDQNLVTTAPAAGVVKSKVCYKCQQEGHIARECPQNAEVYT
ncbi:hypothetical protein EXIGLDRAFT_620761, partial [Exidia glandulosa HHB12029]